MKQPQRSAVRPPDFKLLVGPKNDLRSFAEELIAAGEVRRLHMLLEVAREPLIDGWDNLNVRGGSTPHNISQFGKEVAEFFRDQFLPSLQSIVELAALGIKHQTDLDSWLSPLIDLLVDAFDASRGLNWLKSPYFLQQADSLKWWQSGFEVFIAIRTIAIYAVARKRWTYLGKIIPRCVTPITIDDRLANKTPILFWPFLGLEFAEFEQGRASYYWKARVASSWGLLFGSLLLLSKTAITLGGLVLVFNTSTKEVNRITGRRGIMSWRRVAASSPFITGMETSATPTGGITR